MNSATPFQVAPFYCLQQLVYHTNSQCPQAKSILHTQHRVGMGGKVACLSCRHLNRRKPLKKSRPGQRLNQLVSS
ncbi:hypothetical protein [Spirosoma utsteinense]|uniref:Uncharacterized protein n=1 Tax=Spirosoma utsteinense TaxID=2585773 RepID=A0ABR6W2D5_9BACT|nr:hypothetical protein [Spirosoma utsteinense]MBC3784438.1 hypothetical protein [Spirosoma utsteinense]MBC3790761.1 hypothetical protein [Spirosoma utsteinense]